MTPKARLSWPVLAGLGATLVALLLQARVYAFLCDDAFISFPYTRNLADGHGLVFNAGFERVEGYTNFLWVLLLAAGRALGVAPEHLANPMSLALTVGLWALIARFALRAHQAGDATWPALVAPPALEGVPEKVRQAVSSLRYNSVCSVFIGVRGSVPDISWLYVPSPDTGLMNRVSFPSNYSTGVAPEGCSSVLAEITYNDGDPLTSMSDDEITRHVINSLQAMGLIRNEHVIYAGIARHPFAYVVYDLDYRANISVVRRYCEEIGIDLIGRFAQFEYLNMDGCIRTVRNTQEGRTEWMRGVQDEGQFLRRGYALFQVYRLCDGRKDALPPAGNHGRP